MTHLTTRHLKLKTGFADFISCDAFEQLMADKSVSRFVYASGDLAAGAMKDRDLWDLRKRVWTAYEGRRGQLTQVRQRSSSGGVNFLYVFTKRKFLEDGDK